MVEDPKEDSITDNPEEDPRDDFITEDHTINGIISLKFNVFM